MRIKLFFIVKIKELLYNKDNNRGEKIMKNKKINFSASGTNLGGGA